MKNHQCQFVIEVIPQHCPSSELIFILFEAIRWYYYTIQSGVNIEVSSIWQGLHVWPVLLLRINNYLFWVTHTQQDLSHVTTHTSLHMPWSVATILFAPPLRRNRASLSPREALLLLSPLFPAQSLGQFCPRVFGDFRHFSQKSALKVPQIRALLWAYRGPRERKDAGKRESGHIHMRYIFARSLTYK